MALTKKDRKEIAAIRKSIDLQIRARDAAAAEIEAAHTRLRVYERSCEEGGRRHPNGYETSSMGDRGFYCPDCGYAT